jgi:transposase
MRKTIIIDATFLKAHRTPYSLRVKRRRAGRLIGRTKGGMNTKLHAVADANGRQISVFIAAGQVRDYTGYDADWFRDALQATGITPCIPGRKSRDKTVKYDKRRYKRRNRIEIMFGLSRTGGGSLRATTCAQ